MTSDDTDLTPERVDRLLRHLTVFAGPREALQPDWKGGEENESGALVFPFPSYPDAVLAFFREAGRPWWSDYRYEPREARRMIDEEGFIARADLDQVKTMLTFCVRGERFCDGLWEALIEEGTIRALLERLRALRAEMP